jgi:hypothetical protein
VPSLRALGLELFDPEIRCGREQEQATVARPVE